MIVQEFPEKRSPAGRYLIGDRMIAMNKTRSASTKVERRKMNQYVNALVVVNFNVQR